MFVVLEWESFKDWLSVTTGLTHHDWHVLLGLALTLGFTRVLRRPLGSWLPLLLVLALELVNEVSDFTRYYVSGWPWEPGPTLIDIALTMAPPLAIVIVARMSSPHFFGGGIRYSLTGATLGKSLTRFEEGEIQRGTHRRTPSDDR